MKETVIYLVSMEHSDEAEDLQSPGVTNFPTSPLPY